MITIPTSPALHFPFDELAGWVASMVLGRSLYRWRLKELTYRVALSTGPGYFICLGIGAAAAAWLFGSLNTLRTDIPTLSHTVLGALVGAIAGVEVYKQRFAGIRLSTGAIFVGPFALGIVIGRWGCLFAGLPDQTYGIPTTLPWAVDLGDGIGRHPVQLYESASMLVFLAIFLAALSRRRIWATRRGFYPAGFILAMGAQRFVWEFLKPYPPLLGPLNIFHLLCLGLMFYGSVLLVARLKGPAS